MSAGSPPGSPPGPGLGATVKKEEEGHNAAGDKPKPPAKAEKVEKKKAQKVDLAQREAADGDVEDFNPEWSEPKGTLHVDQFKTQFPGEKTTRKA